MSTKVAITALILSFLCFVVIAIGAVYFFVLPAIGRYNAASLRFASADLPPEIEVTDILAEARRTEGDKGKVAKVCGAKVFQLSSTMVQKVRARGLDALRDARWPRLHSRSENHIYGPWQPTPISNDIYTSERALSGLDCGIPPRLRSIVGSALENEGGYYAESTFYQDDVVLILVPDRELAFFAYRNRE